MPKSTNTKKRKVLKDFFNDLNEAQKIKVRDAYLETFESKKNTFYRVLRQDRKLKKLEKDFFVEQLNKPLNILF